MAVIVPAARRAALAVAPGERFPAGSVSAAPEPDLERPLVLLTARQAKGLEFDGVVLVDPAGVVGESVRGLNDLYVAMTRPTARLVVLYPGAIPPLLEHLPPRAPAGPC